MPLAAVPKQFDLGGRTWRVKFVKRRRPFGETDFDRALITLSSRLKKDPDLLAQSFLHELLHATSDAMGWQRINEDENRIDALAGLLAQALKTATPSLTFKATKTAVNRT